MSAGLSLIKIWQAPVGYVSLEGFNVLLWLTPYLSSMIFYFTEFIESQTWYSPRYSGVRDQGITWAQECVASLGETDTPSRKTYKQANRKFTGLPSWRQEEILDNLQEEKLETEETCQFTYRHIVVGQGQSWHHHFPLKLYTPRFICTKYNFPPSNHWMYVKAYFLILFRFF